MDESDRPAPEPQGRPDETVPTTRQPPRAAMCSPVLPLRDIVVFPHMIVPLFVGREKSVRALEEVMNDEKQILLLAQKNAAQDDPTADDIHSVGTLSTVLQLLKLPDQTVRVLVEGGRRARSPASRETDSYFQANVEAMPDAGRRCQGTRGARPHGGHAISSSTSSSTRRSRPRPWLADPDRGAGEAGRHGGLPSVGEDRRAPGAAGDRQGHRAAGEGVRADRGRDRRAAGREGIRSRVKRQMEKTQREYYLNEQLKAIQKELGEGEEGRDEIDELEERIRKTKLSKEAREKAMAEVKKLRP